MGPSGDDLLIFEPILKIGQSWLLLNQLCQDLGSSQSIQSIGQVVT
jgi:hypothetical protein